MTFFFCGKTWESETSTIFHVEAKRKFLGNPGRD
jgi:hypothetical protein